MRHGRRISALCADILARRHAHAHGHKDVDARALADAYRPSPYHCHRSTNGHSLADADPEFDRDTQPNRYARSYKHSLADPHALG